MIRLYILLFACSLMSTVLTGCKAGSAIDHAVVAITSAKTANEEKDAFLATHASTNSYKLEFYNATGGEIFPHQTGEYASVVTLKITWPSGQSVTKRIIDPMNLLLLVGE